MTHEHGKRFPFEKIKKLDSAERRALQPPEPIVEALELFAGCVAADLGAGTGYFALPIATSLVASGGGRVLALDVEPRMLELTDERAVEAGLGEAVSTVQVPETGPLPIDGDSVDRVLLANVAHELADPVATFTELARALRPGGIMLIVDWSPDGPFDHGPPADHRLPPEAVERALLEAGFRSTHRVELYEHFYAIRAELK